MASDLILTPAQAQAVYSAMCALNAVGARLTTEFPAAAIRVSQMDDASIVVQNWPSWSGAVEDYDGPAAFAAAYGLSAAPVLSTLVDELSRIGEVRQGDAVLTKDATGYHMRSARDLFGRFRHDLPADTTGDRLEAHWAGFVANVRAA